MPAMASSRTALLSFGVSPRWPWSDGYAAPAAPDWGHATALGLRRGGLVEVHSGPAGVTRTSSTEAAVAARAIHRSRVAPSWHDSTLARDSSLTAMPRATSTARIAAIFPSARPAALP